MEDLALTQSTNLSPQIHLTTNEQINLESYYTKPDLVETVYHLLRKHVFDLGRYTIIDTSCGYGSFLNCNIFNKKIGADIDSTALRKTDSPVNLLNHNRLSKVSRADYM